MTKTYLSACCLFRASEVLGLGERRIARKLLLAQHHKAKAEAAEDAWFPICWACITNIDLFHSDTFSF